MANYCAHDGAPKGAEFAAVHQWALRAFSAGCKAALANVASTTSVCADDIAKQCPGIGPGSGRILFRVKKHYPALGEACKAAIGQAGANRAQARSAN